MAGLAVLALAGAGCAAPSPGSARAVRAGTASVPVRVTASPRGLLPALVAVASRRVVYLLGRAAGSAGSAPVRLFRSDHAGRLFRPVSTPVARSPRTGRPLRVNQLWFAGPSDGYALFGTWGQPGPLLVTSDGARTWHPASVGGRGLASAVADRGSHVYALVARCASGGTGCPVTMLYRSVAGSRTWTLVRAAGLAQAGESGGLSLAASGRSVWVMVGNGGIGSPLLLWSVDGGRSFRQVAVPTVGCGLTATSPAVAWLSCSGGMMLTFDRWSGGRLTQLPVTGAGTGNTFLDPVSSTAVYFGTAVGGSAGLYLSRDGGARFTKIAPLPAAFRSGTAAYITFLNLRTGLSWTYRGRLLRTTNGGRTWTAVHQ